MDCLSAAFAQRGIDYRSTFSSQRPIADLTQRYFVRERAFGKNWLLVGGTFIQIWYPSSSGLWTVVAAAGMAPHLINEPMRFGAHTNP